MVEIFKKALFMQGQYKRNIICTEHGTQVKKRAHRFNIQMPIDMFSRYKKESRFQYIDRFLWQGGTQKCDVAKFTISVCIAVLCQ